MDKDSKLKGQFLETFILGLKQLAAGSAPPNYQGSSQEENRNRVIMWLAEEQFYTHMQRKLEAMRPELKGGLSQQQLRDIGDSYNFGKSLPGIPLEKLGDELRKVVQGIVQTPAADVLARESMNMMQALAVGRGRVLMNSVMEECMALQEDKVQAYIDKEITGYLKGYPHSGNNMHKFGYDYLREAQKFAESPADLRDVFRRAEIQATKTGFEREVGALNPDMPKTLLSLECQKQLSLLSQKNNLPMPSGRAVG